MSVKCMSLVWDRTFGNPVRKAIMLYLADRSDDDGASIYPSKQRIADHIEFGRSTVIRTINELVEEKFLLIDGRHAKARTTIYRLNIHKIQGLPLVRAPVQKLITDSLTAGQSQSGTLLGYESQSGTPIVPERDPDSPAAGPNTSINHQLTGARAREEIFEELRKLGCSLQDIESLQRHSVDYDGGWLVVGSRFAKDQAEQSLGRHLKQLGVQIVIRRQT